MKSFFILLSCFSMSVMAETFTDRIHSVVSSADGNHIVRFENGRVGFIKGDTAESLRQNEGLKVTVDLDKNYDVLKLEVIPTEPEYDVFLKNINEGERPPFETSVISMDQLNEAYSNLNTKYKRRSECSDRAHVWAYDEFKRTGVKSQKAFILFTASYINRVRFKWWFHVAPMFDVSTGSGVQKMVIDHMYKDRPVTLKEWSNMMVFSLRDCKMTTKFSEYDVNPQTEDCYMIHESMYYRLPGDVHNQELRGTYRSNWNEFEVKSARGWAFNEGVIQ